MEKFCNRTILRIGIVFLILTGAQAVITAQQRAGSAINPQARRAYRPLDTNTECTSRGGIWRDGHGCYLVLEGAVKITNHQGEVPYPKTEKSCQRVAGIWSGGKCAVIYSQLVTSSQSATRQGVKYSPTVLMEKTKTEAENCNESGGAWATNKDGGGFCYRLLTPETCTLSKIVCSDATTLPPMKSPN